MRKVNWELELPVNIARENEEIVALADSQILRWIDELNGNKDDEQRASLIRREIRATKKLPPSSDTKRQIRNLYNELDNLQYKPDYMCLVIDTKKDYYRACKGFYINGIKYTRLLGTAGGIKNSTIVFVSERLAPELRRRIDNNRDLSKELVPAKFEAYRALVCSGSSPVSSPRGILVVDDCITTFKSNITSLSERPGGEPLMEPVENADVELNCCDGCGMMSPALAKRWSEELYLGYTCCGFNTRFAWEKGMVFTFDFHKFAKEVAGRYVVKDVWGDYVDIRDVELILTTSMIKLWDSYKNCNEYLRSSYENGYSFAIAKTCPEELDNEHTLNYQFLQSYELSDSDIEELIEPTVQEFHEVLGGDPMKMILFMKGTKLDERSFDQMDNDPIKGLLIDPSLSTDSQVRRKVYENLKNRINEAKVGVLKVHGNYSILSGDLYALAQSAFGLPVTGLLKAGELYSQYWRDNAVDEVVCFRAPMSCHSNIRKMKISRDKRAEEWFQYINTCTILNAWDTTCHAMNGCDFDGDIVLTTDNPVLLRNTLDTPALLCEQRKAPKKIPTESNIVESNINGFGDDIGKITNRVTSMYTIRSSFPKDSEEYKILSYRINCGQLLQQAAIDRVKGIMSTPMPKIWYDSFSLQDLDDGQKEFEYRIVADRKPYFMTYIYPELKKSYTRYSDAAKRQCRRQLGIELEDLQSAPRDEITEEQAAWLQYYWMKMPVRTEPCVMNRICWRIEAEFNGFLKQLPTTSADEDYDFIPIDDVPKYTSRQYYAIKKAEESYTEKIIKFLGIRQRRRIDTHEAWYFFRQLREHFMVTCYRECPNSHVLYNLICDLVKKTKISAKFIWGMVGDVTIEYLLKQNNNTIQYPIRDDEGDIVFCGKRFRVHKQIIQEEEK